MIYSRSKYNQKKLVELDQLIFPELKMKKDIEIVPKAFEFSLRVLELYIELLKVNEFDLSEKLLKSGTGIRNTIEDSLKYSDMQERFNSIASASREAVEVRYWLKLIQMKYFISGSVLDDCVEKINEIINTLNAMSGEGTKNKDLINSINFN